MIIFIGPPFAGKDTQAKLLGQEINLPVYSMGALIREAYEKGDPLAIEGFENYSMKGLHLPINLKFHLIKDKMEALHGKLIIDNFPANQEDLDVFRQYLSEKNLKIDKVFYLKINKEEMQRRLIHRGRRDDNAEIILKRREHQDLEREPVLDYFRNQGLLIEIDGASSIKEVHKEIMRRVNG